MTKMIHYPITITDDFLEDPDYVVELSKTATYTNPDGGRWPGVRSQPLHDLDNDFYQYLMQRYYLMFFSHEELERDWRARATSYFQRIPSNLDHGFIHHDHPKVHTFIIYLTPGADPESGTGFFQGRTWDQTDNRHNEKLDYYTHKITPEESRVHADEHNGQYIQTAFCGNVYNRCVGFDSNLAHGVVNYKTNTENQERLTLITFVDEITSTRTPLGSSRSKPFVRTPGLYK
jgi:hypothetical protein